MCNIQQSLIGPYLLHTVFLCLGQFGVVIVCGAMCFAANAMNLSWAAPCVTFTEAGGSPYSRQLLREGLKKYTNWWTFEMKPNFFLNEMGQNLFPDKMQQSLIHDKMGQNHNLDQMQQNLDLDKIKDSRIKCNKI